MVSNKGHILIVDDDPSINRMFQLLLKDAGYRVSSTTNSEDTLKYLKIIVPDVILLDISLPGMDGVELAHRIKHDQTLPFIPIIHITALGDMRTKVAALDAGSDDILIKPVEFAELLARVRVMIRLRQSRRSLEETTRRVQLLYSISQTLTSSLEINTVLNQIVNQLCAALDAVRTSIILVNDKLQLTFHASSASDPVDAEHIAQVLREGVAGWVLRARKPLIIADARRDQRWIWLERGLDPTRSIICVPLLHKQTILGVITAVHTRLNYFNDVHLELIQSVAAQSVVAFDHAQLFQTTIQQKHQLERRSHMLEEMLHVGEQIRLNLPLSDLLSEIAASVQRSLGFGSVLIHIFEPDGSTTQGYAGNVKVLKNQWTTATITDVVVPMLNEQSRISRSFRLPRQLVTNRALLNDDESYGEHLVVPIGTLQTLSGIIVVDVAWGTSQLDLSTIQSLEVFANQVATVVQNNQLFNLELQRGNQLQLLVDIGRSIAELMTPDQLLRLVASLVRHTFGFRAVHIVLREDQQWTIRVSAGHDETAFHEPQHQEALFARISSSQRIHSTYNGNFSLNYSTYDPPIRAELTLPLSQRNDIYGFLIAASESSQPFGRMTESLLEAIAAQLMIALENAKLFALEQEYVQQMARINQLSVALTAEHDLFDHLPTVLADIHVIFAARQTALILNDDNQHMTIIQYPPQDLPHGLPSFEAFQTDVVTRQFSLINTDSEPKSALRTMVLKLGMSNAVIEVLPIDTGFDGFLLIEPAQSQRWRMNERTMIQTVANLLTQAIEKSQLEQQRMQRLRADMSRYMAPQLVDQLLTEGGFGDIAERDVVVLFADLRGFTALSEQLAPRIVVEQILNRFFDVMTDVLYQHEALIDKFLGDGLMVVFGSVRPRADDVARAIRAARAMQQAFRGLRTTWQKDFGQSVGLGIGMSWGRAVVGNIGSAQRLDYTVIGDVVNTASRLVSVAEAGQVIISQQLAAKLPAAMRRGLRPLPPVMLKGKSEPQEIFTLGRTTKPLD